MHRILVGSAALVLAGHWLTACQVSGDGERSNARAAITTNATRSVLILGSTVTGGLTSIEADEVARQGYTPVIADAATWGAKTTAQFAEYQAIILGDPTCSSEDSIAAAISNAATWGSAVNGNIIILGTDPVFHAGQGGEILTRQSIDFALAQSGKTGAYIALSCYYESASANTPLHVLDGIRSGAFAVRGNLNCYNNAHIVAQHPALNDLTDANLSNWSCSVHEAFDAWPADFTVLAIAKDFSTAFTASDGTQGPPYILAAGLDLVSFPLSAFPKTASAAAGTTHTVMAQLLDIETSEPVSGQLIGFTITGGPNRDITGTCSNPGCLTAANGQVSWTYQSNGQLGADAIEVFVDENGNSQANVGEPQTTAAMIWQAGCPPDLQGRAKQIGEGYPLLKLSLVVRVGEAFEVARLQANVGLFGTTVDVEGPDGSLTTLTTNTATFTPTAQGKYIIRACSNAHSPEDAVVTVVQAGTKRSSPISHGVGVFWSRDLDASAQQAPDPIPNQVHAAQNAWKHVWQDAWDGLSMLWGKCAGGQITHLGFDWPQIEKAAGACSATPVTPDCQWFAADRQLALAEEFGLQKVVFTGLTPPFAQRQVAGNQQAIFCPPDESQVSSFESFHQALAARYCGRVQYFEFWNEPNTTTGVHYFDPVGCQLPNQDREASYAVWLNRWSDAMKRGCPTAVLAVGGLDCNGDTSSDCNSFINKVINNGGRFDAVAMHPYRSTATPQDWAINWGEVQEVQEELMAAGNPAKILIDEWAVAGVDQTALNRIQQVFDVLKHPLYERVIETRYLTLTDVLPSDGRGLVDTVYSVPRHTPRPTWEAISNALGGGSASTCSDTARDWTRNLRQRTRHPPEP